MVKQLIYDSCMIVEKGTEVHRGRGFASKSFKPSAEADGKREPTATRQTSFVSLLINHHLQVQIFLDYPLNTPWLFYLIRVHTVRETL